MYLKYLEYELATPCHVLDVNILSNNLDSINFIKSKTDCICLFAIKGFSNSHFFQYFDNTIDGIAASGLYEARFAKEIYKKQVHIFSSSYTNYGIGEISKYSDFIIFNSVNQLKLANGISNKLINYGIRINPEYSEQKKYKIDPCHPYSRFGIHYEDFSEDVLRVLSGLHFHTMCEQFDSTLDNTVNEVTKKFGNILNDMSWINIGGGQLFANSEYNKNNAIATINQLKNNYNLQIIMEPCEAIMENVGIYICKVVDIIQNGIDILILDGSAICHLPDIINSPYRCDIYGGYEPYERKYTYRLCGCSCYAGDIFGDYSFDDKKNIGDYIVFKDTAPYTMVKNIMFNGIRPPNIYEFSNNHMKLIKEYNYELFKAIT